MIPIKALPAAKSRLGDATGDAAAHARLVAAIRADTLAAVRATPTVARVVVITDRAAPTGGADSGGAAGDGPTATIVGDVNLGQTQAGLNAAVREAAGYCARRWPADGLAALVGDLPALRPDELASALAAAAHHRRAYVADAAATGTTLLTSTAPIELAPSFGVGSARRHAAVAAALDAGPGLRLDVDTAADLAAAAALGVGPATRAVLVDQSERAEPADRSALPAVHLDPA